MSVAGATKLLQRDRAELDRIATAFREGRTVVGFVACADSLRPAAIEYLRENGKTWVIPDPVEPADAGAMLSLLVDALGKPPREIFVVVIRPENTAAMDALNLHREKLREGASKLIFVQGADGIAALRSRGRDAYTFRDLLAYLMGEEPVPEVGAETEAEALTEARERYGRAVVELAAAAADLGQELRVKGDLLRAERVLRGALAQYEGNDLNSEGERTLHARLYRELANVMAARGSAVEAYRLYLHGLRLLVGATSADAALQRRYMLAVVPGPYGQNRRFLQQALESGDVDIEGQTTRSQVELNCVYGNCRGLNELLRDLPTSEHIFNEALVKDTLADFQIALGQLMAAETTARRVSEMLGAAGSSHVYAHHTLAQSLFLRGEIAASERVVAAVLEAKSEADKAAAIELGAQIAVEKGNIKESVETLRTLIKSSLDAGADRNHYGACASLVEILQKAHEANRLSTNDLLQADNDLELAEDLSRAAFGTDPPWYTIFFTLRRSELLALRPDRLPEAFTLSQIALDHARASSEELVPEAARIHGHHLVRLARYDEAISILLMAINAARAETYLREQAAAERLLVLTHVLANHPASDIEAALSELRKTLEASGSPRILAENLLDLARALPPETRTPDPFALAEEALALFQEMPYPAKAAACLETQGDVLVARGDTEDALRRYRPAFHLLTRHGLLLRVPVLESKMAPA